MCGSMLKNWDRSSSDSPGLSSSIEAVCCCLCTERWVLYFKELMVELGIFVNI